MRGHPLTSSLLLVESDKYWPLVQCVVRNSVKRLVPELNSRHCLHGELLIKYLLRISPAAMGMRMVVVVVN